MSSTIGDLFYGFQKDPIKALKIGAVISVIDSICMIPFDIASVELSSVLGSVDINKLSLMLANGSVDSYESLAAYNVFYSTMMKFYLIMLVCALVSLILTLPFFPAFYMILDFPEWSATTILKRSFEVMHGNKLRLFLLNLSFIPLYLLSIFTCGLALLFVIPYAKMTPVCIKRTLRIKKCPFINSIYIIQKNYAPLLFHFRNALINPSRAPSITASTFPDSKFVL